MNTPKWKISSSHNLLLLAGKSGSKRWFWVVIVGSSSTSTFSYLCVTGLRNGRSYVVLSSLSRDILFDINLICFLLERSLNVAKPTFVTDNLRSFRSIKCMLFARNISISFRADYTCYWIANWGISGGARYLSLLCTDDCTTHHTILIFLFLLAWFC